jgi:transcriptional regulator with XRE-family HTH domain
LAQFSGHQFLLCRNEGGAIRYAPLCIHTFRLVAPRKLLEAQLFNQRYQSYAEIKSIPDRLRWCRHHLGLTQEEVARRVGISRASYIDLEQNAVDHYKKETVDKLAALFGIPSTDLLDEYNLFLYQGQGARIHAYRTSLGLDQRGLARELHIDPSMLQTWEAEKKQMTKASWTRYFKERVSG